ncbi:MAG: hypothetical protein GY896_12310 [Gammaproteobacteria bacterium]|nr:hypothetical protein [Gammaproteobacteria bacterium]
MDLLSSEPVSSSEKPISKDHHRYYFVTPTGARPNQVLDDFRDWLIEISKAYRDDPI